MESQPDGHARLKESFRDATTWAECITRIVTFFSAVGSVSDFFVSRYGALTVAVTCLAVAFVAFFCPVVFQFRELKKLLRSRR